MSYGYSNGNDMVMPVTPMGYGNGGNGNGGFGWGGDGAWWLLVLFLFENLMDAATSDYERQEIRKMIETIEKQER